MTAHSRPNLDIESLSRQIRALRRTVWIAISTFGLAFLLGAAAKTAIDGDLDISGALKCSEMSTAKSVEVGADAVIKNNLRVGGTVNGVNITDLKEELDAVKSKVETMKPLLTSVNSRNIVETRIIPMGLFEHGEHYWSHDFEPDVLTVCGFVQDTDGDYAPLIGECKAQTVGLSMQRVEGGQLRVRVTFQPRYNKLPFAFVCIIVKRAG